MRQREDEHQAATRNNAVRSLQENRAELDGLAATAHALLVSKNFPRFDALGRQINTVWVTEFTENDRCAWTLIPQYADLGGQPHAYLFADGRLMFHYKLQVSGSPGLGQRVVYQDITIPFQQFLDGSVSIYHSSRENFASMAVVALEEFIQRLEAC